ncbi:TetR/AcrR family transcriptional regulator [Streptomyces fuscigenes]|uniref:TetR/AcrR family transcriptional regulator n=1 Tax=Streptomyces fuscigenes TaxID=1528880 RepID=UPI001F2D461E|nr:TetR/AcrR family transcriptional regulator [Streptomyces fuscigenes]MCF3960579.1 TetR/AcrR family transcriptional regulator [Streptomyces fuscigenes]
MPTPERTSLEAIVEAARDILETQGIAQLTMQAVGSRVGVRAPSLYKRVRNRDTLLRLVTEATLRDLEEHLGAVPVSADPGERLGHLLRAMRAFAHSRPAAYHLIFSNTPAPTRPEPALLAHSAAPLLETAAELAGPDQALEAARTVTAWAHGFISMELAHAFNLGGDVERAYEYGMARLASALTEPGAPAEPGTAAESGAPAGPGTPAGRDGEGAGGR